jgi:polysaccharide export outer membrane protein
MIRNWIFFLIAFVLGSCISQKDMIYVKNIDINEKYIAKDLNKSKDLVIGTGDQLSITVDGVDRESIRPFNIQHDLNPSIRSYLVDSKGDITFPVVGKIRVNGLTKAEITKLVDEKLTPFLKNPTITVQLENFQVSVLGEVNRPGKYSTQNDRITIFEALSLAGDITLYGKKRNVLVTRELNGKIEFARLDLTSPEIFKSEYYFLKQNDVIYIEPNRLKPVYSPNVQSQLSIVGIATTLITSIVLIIKK